MTHFFDSTENIFKYFLLYLAALPGVLRPGVALLLLSFFPTACKQRSLAVYIRFSTAVNFFKKRCRVIPMSTILQHPQDLYADSPTGKDEGH